MIITVTPERKAKFQYLHDGWQVQDSRDKRWISACVPGCVHTDLLAHNAIPDPFWGRNERALQWIEESDWLYALTFSVAEDLLDEDFIDLVAEGLDTLATITLNGVEIGQTENMFHPFIHEVKALLRAGHNELKIHFYAPMPEVRKRMRPDHYAEWNDPVGGASLLRKQQCSFGWDWGPRLATSGIWRPLYLRAWSAGRIEHVRLRQTHSAGAVHIEIEPLADKRTEPATATYAVRLFHNGAVVHAGEDLAFTVADPKLWWPAGHGEQPLYTLEVDLLVEGVVRDTWKRRIGLRTIRLDRHADEWGECFQFVVNGRALFAKGANWIPAHAFVNEAGEDTIRSLLRDCVAANMNMIRVWGGGIYEPAVFYDTCDELGLLVWQDYMFACGLYPGDDAFLASVREEAVYQARRLAHHASLALWCGNNENEFIVAQLKDDPARTEAYGKLFYELLDDVTRAESPATGYWPSSPHNPAGYREEAAVEHAGDYHFWEVWHARKPVRLYEEKFFRFCSEFGMQSFSSPAVASSFCAPEEQNIFRPEMENHQKNPAGNQIILDYIGRRYPFPHGYAELAYLSQLNQAYCLKTGVEHWRRNAPRCMGALYWQLNDNWPVFSWSSIEFGGQWKAAHHAARRFFNPLLITAHVPGEDKAKTGNWIHSTREKAHCHLVYDAPEASTGYWSYRLYHADGHLLDEARKEVNFQYGMAERVTTLDLRPWIEEYGHSHLFLRLEAASENGFFSEDTILLTEPRLFAFAPEGPELVSIEEDGDGFFVTLQSPHYQQSVELSLPDVCLHTELNYFDLYPGEARRIRVQPFEVRSLDTLRTTLSIRSLNTIGRDA